MNLEDKLWQQMRTIGRRTCSSRYRMMTQEHRKDPGGARVSVGGEEVHHEHHPRPARGITRPVSLTKTQRKKHYLEGHANYDPGCPSCVRCKGLADRHERCERDEDVFQQGDEDEPEDVPRSASTSASSCRRSRARPSRPWSHGTTSRATPTRSRTQASPQRRRSVATRLCIGAQCPWNSWATRGCP